MTWYAYNNMKCLSCGHRYKQENGTLNVYDKGHTECPLCGGEVVVDRNKSLQEFLALQETLKEQFTNRPKRILTFGDNIAMPEYDHLWGKS